MRQQQREHTREQILDAAVRVFARQGFEGASMSDIAVAASHKKALVQYHFSTKENLWRRAMDHLWIQRDQVLPGYLEDTSPDEGAASLRAIFRALMAFNHNHPEWVALVFRESAAPGPRLTWLIEQHLRQDIERGSEFIGMAQRAGLLPDVSALQLLHLVSGALCYTQLVAPMTAQATGIDLTTDQAMDQQVDILMQLVNPA